MENYSYALECLWKDLSVFFDGYLRPFSSSPLSFRKHTVEKKEVEISSYLGSLVKCVNSGDSSSSNNHVTEILPLLQERSQNWTLPLSEISTSGNNLFFKISRNHAFQNVLSAIFNLDEEYGNRSALKLKFAVTTESNTAKNLTEFRLELLAGVTRNLLSCAGYEFTEASENAQQKLHFTTKGSLGHDHVVCQCGYVVNSEGARSQLGIEAYHRLREQDMRAMSEHKYWEAGRETTVKLLAAAAVAMDLIQIKSSNPVKLVTDHEIVTGTREKSSKGAVFVLYNCARLSVLQKKFNDFVTKELYPPLPLVQDIDTTLLVQDEEWQLLFNFLLEYPVLLSRTVAGADKGEINQHILCSFVFKLCHTFSVYYCRQRILQEPKPHLLETIFTRYTLVLAVHKVLKHALKILNINTIEYM